MLDSLLVFSLIGVSFSIPPLLSFFGRTKVRLDSSQSILGIEVTLDPLLVFLLISVIFFLCLSLSAYFQLSCINLIILSTIVCQFFFSFTRFPVFFPCTVISPE